MTVAKLCDEYMAAAEKGLVLSKTGRRKAPLTRLRQGAHRKSYQAVDWANGRQGSHVPRRCEVP
jgi:hypothetical protein